MSINITYAFSLTGNIAVGNAFSVEGNVELYRPPAYYTGDYTVTPTKSQQTLHTNNLILTNDVTVNAIPDIYIDTTIASGAAGAGQILDGYKAYANGALVEGTAVAATATVSGTTLVLGNGFPVSVE